MPSNSRIVGGVAWFVCVACSSSSAHVGGTAGATSGGAGGANAGGGGLVISLDGATSDGGRGGTLSGTGGATAIAGTMAGGGGAGIGGATEPPGTWVPTPPTGGSGGKGKTDAGALDAGAIVCAPGMSGAIVTPCGYPYASNVPLTNVSFNESEVLRAVRAVVATNGGIVSLLYNDEHALTLGVRSVAVKSANGTTTTTFPVSPLATNPGAVTDPKTGANDLTGNNSGLDPSLRPLWPVLYMTDITTDPTSRAGDWQMGGRPINPSAVYGTWKGAVRTVDLTTKAVSVTPDADPAKNNWNLGINEPIPPGIANEGWSAEVKWNVSFQAGHSYRMQVIVHDGDQTKVGGDCGEACVIFCASDTSTPECPSGSQSCDSNDGVCNEGETCVNGCCQALDCPSASACLGPRGEVLGCPTGTSCVSGCCVDDTIIIY